MSIIDLKSYTDTELTELAHEVDQLETKCLELLHLGISANCELVKRIAARMHSNLNN